MGRVDGLELEPRAGRPGRSAPPSARSPPGPHPGPPHGSLRTVFLFFTHLFVKIFKRYFVENYGIGSGKATLLE